MFRVERFKLFTACTQRAYDWLHRQNFQYDVYIGATVCLSHEHAKNFIIGAIAEGLVIGGVTVHIDSSGSTWGNVG